VASVHSFDKFLEVHYPDYTSKGDQHYREDIFPLICFYCWTDSHHYDSKEEYCEKAILSSRHVYHEHVDYCPILPLRFDCYYLIDKICVIYKIYPIDDADQH
jgi:hypothetical protein